MSESLLTACARLLVALARMALEHDRGYASRKVWQQVKDAIDGVEAQL